LHWTAPLVHAEQLPALQIVAQAEPLFCQLPPESQSCGCRPLHCIAPGVHTPEQLPPVHVLVHGVPDTQVPVESHVCGVSPLHCVAPGVQLPVQPLVVQMYWQTDPKFDQSPPDPHSCG
jgi:hypothetical protein